MTEQAVPATDDNAAIMAGQMQTLMDEPFRVVTPEEKKRTAALWLVTFTDIMALMLTFFVLLYTMSVPREDEWTRMTSALGREFGKQYSPPALTGAQDAINIDKVDFSKALDLDYLAVLLKETLKDNERAKGILMINRGDSLIVSMPDSLLFEAGQAQVLDEGRKTLFAMGEALSKIRNSVEIVGHADPRPVGAAPSNAFASNWELSLSRAANVASILQSTGYSKPMTLRGMSSARYDELPADLGEDKRLDLSRRVDIVILKTTGAQVQRYNFTF
ncbi:MAG TPA: flagellar motor protein MotB [Alphaproteobacteria bacterium]|nr:flagellar motor protein MotB [Alphaproteobacteria bacterium]